MQKRLFADNGLAPENVEALLLLLLRACAERIEAALLDKDFDRLGALQLDREMRALAKRGAELCNRSVRDCLARLTQLCTVLNLDREAELAELWGDGQWRISGAVASDVARLRVDFRELIPSSLARRCIETKARRTLHQVGRPAEPPRLWRLAGVRVTL